MLPEASAFGPRKCEPPRPGRPALKDVTPLVSSVTLRLNSLSGTLTVEIVTCIDKSSKRFDDPSRLDMWPLKDVD